MDSGEMLTAIRTTAFLPPTDPVFTDARLRQEITDAQHGIVERAVVNSGGDYWLKREKVTTTAGKQRYRVPYRAVAGVVKALKMGTGLTTDAPAPKHRFLGDLVEFETAPDAGRVLTFEYYLRPSRLVEPQTDGRITAIDTTLSAPSVTVNVIPDRMLGTGAPTAIASLGRVDIVRPTGWHEVVVPNVICIIVGSTVTLLPDTDLTDVEVGDYVRSADESEWPCLPDDFHRMLADVSAVAPLIAKNMNEKAGAVLANVKPVMDRLQDLLTPRNKTRPPAVFPNVGILRRRGRIYGNLPR